MHIYFNFVASITRHKGKCFGRDTQILRKIKRYPYSLQNENIHSFQQILRNLFDFNDLQHMYIRTRNAKN